MKVLLYLLAGTLIGGGGMYLLLPKCPDVVQPTHKGVLGFHKFASGSSGPISFEAARRMHRKYLQDCADDNEDTGHVSLRYLRVDKKDLEALYMAMPADGALRIYFGDKRAIAGDSLHVLPDYLTTFLVAVDSKGMLLINRSTINPTVAQGDIVDNLPPCPDNCPDSGGNPVTDDGFN